MSTEQNKIIAHQHYENIADLQAAFALVSPDVVFHAMPGLPPTYEGWYQAHTMFLTAFPDIKINIEDEIGEGDKVVTRWTFQGTHQGELMGMPATGKRVSVSGISTDRIANGKVVEHWAELDMLGLMQQLGVAPTA
jgi:steroid delta-isomerase-like uncharacterized protein